MYAEGGLQKCAQENASGLGQYIRPTRRQQLQDMKLQLVKQLTVIDKAIAALDDNPKLEEFAEALSRAGV